MSSIEVALFVVIALMMGFLGTDVLAAHQIVYQCFFLVSLIVLGLAQGAATRVSHEVGRDNRFALRLAAFVNIGLGVCVMLVFAVIYWWGANFIIRLDLDPNEARYSTMVHFLYSFCLLLLCYK